MNGDPRTAPASRSDTPRMPAGRVLAGATVILALWVLTRGYEGIRHDAELYVAQALAHLHPEVFAQDLFFAFGSQADYTIFPRLHAYLIDRFDPAAADLCLLVSGQALWLVGAVVLVRSLGHALHRSAAGWLMIVLIIGMPATYGSGAILTYGEGYLTPRLFAEAATLLAMAALMSDRRTWLLAPLAVAIVLHPLVGLQTAAVALVFLALGDRRWVLLPIAGGIALVASALAGVEPSVRLMQAMDGDWGAMVRARSPYNFPTLWSAREWAGVAFALATVTAGSFAVGGMRRRGLAAAAIVAAVGMAGAVAGDVTDNVLLIQLQGWRSMWLVHLLAYPALVLIALRLRHRVAGPAILALFVAAWADTPFPLMRGLFCAMALGLAWAEISGRPIGFSRASRIMAFGCAAAAIGLWGFFHLWHLSSAWHVAPLLDRQPLAMALDNQAVTALLAAISIAALAWLYRGGVADRAAVAVLALALIVSAWDQRTDWRRLLAAPSAHPGVTEAVQAIDAIVPEDAAVFWPESPLAAWTLLSRPSYVSRIQGAGVVYSSQTAQAYRQRMQRVAVFLPAWSSERPDHGPECSDVRLGSDARTAMIEICAAAPDLRYVILPGDGLTGDGRDLAAAQWTLSAPRTRFCHRDGVRDTRTWQAYALYDCRALTPDR